MERGNTQRGSESLYKFLASITVVIAVLLLLSVDNAAITNEAPAPLPPELVQWEVMLQ
jgi:hypothetical protein